MGPGEPPVGRRRAFDRLMGASDQWGNRSAEEEFSSRGSAECAGGGRRVSARLGAGPTSELGRNPVRRPRFAGRAAR